MEDAKTDCYFSRQMNGFLPGKRSTQPFKIPVIQVYPRERPEDTMNDNPAAPEKKEKQEMKREELIGKVLTVNDLVQYQEGSIASRMIVFKKAGTITLFSFDKGEGLSEHSAPYDAILTVTDGAAEVTIAGAPFLVRTGEMIIMPANIPHAVQAKQRFKMTLTMVKE
jgi:quercetin dioxygenase-like cupin family protein